MWNHFFHVESRTCETPVKLQFVASTAPWSRRPGQMTNCTCPFNWDEAFMHVKHKTKNGLRIFPASKRYFSRCRDFFRFGMVFFPFSKCSPHHCGVLVFFGRIPPVQPPPPPPPPPPPRFFCSTHFISHHLSHTTRLIHNSSPSSHSQLISHTTHLIQNSSHTTHLTHNSSHTQLVPHTTHFTQLISHTTHLIPHLTHNSSHTPHLTRLLVACGAACRGSPLRGKCSTQSFLKELRRG